MNRPRYGVQVEPQQDMSSGRFKVALAVSASEEGSPIIKQVEKPINEYLRLEKQIASFAFDFEVGLEKSIKNAKEDQQKAKQLQAFINKCVSRPDITKSAAFNKFFGLPYDETEADDFIAQTEHPNLNAGVKDMVVVDFAWNSQAMTLVTIHAVKKQTSKISNYLMNLLDKKTKSGLIQVHQLVETQEKERYMQRWSLLASTETEAEPRKIKWHPKSGFMTMLTDIGVYIYTVTLGRSVYQCQLFDFVKCFDIQDMQFGPASASIYYNTREHLKVYSIKQELSLDLNVRPFRMLSGLAIDKNETRLYSAAENCLRIFDIRDPKQIKQLACIELDKQSNRSLVCSDKYLFSVSPLGYVAVFEVRPVGKQRLTCVLTHLDCPKDTPMFDFLEHHEVIITSHNQHIVIVSTQNVPLFAGGAHQFDIVCGRYYELTQEAKTDKHESKTTCSRELVVIDEGGNVIFYAVNMRKVITE